MATVSVHHRQVVERSSAASATPLKNVQFYYDAFDRRIAKTVDYNPTELPNPRIDFAEYYVYNGAHVVFVLQDVDGDSGPAETRLARRILHGDAVDRVLAEEVYENNTGPRIFAMTPSSTPATPIWPIADHLGSVRDVLDGSGVVRTRSRYDSYGNRTGTWTRHSDGTVLPPLNAARVDSFYAYTGREFDRDVGLQYNRARWYDPTTGRWISQDPIGFAGGDANLYRYVGNGPSMSTDPSGLIDPRVITPEELKELKEMLPPLSGETEEDYLKSLNVVVRRQPDDFVAEFDYFPFGMHGSIHLTDDYFLRRNLPVPTMVCHGMSAMGRVGPVNSFRFEHPARMQEYIETQYVFANIALLFVPLPIGKAPVRVPHGFSSADDFALAGRELAEALQQSGLKASRTGVRGSAATGVSSKGGGFRVNPQNGMKASDVDVFVELADDVAISASKKIPGFIHPDKMMKEYPALRTWSEKWSKKLGREITPGGFKPGTFCDPDTIGF